MEYNLRCVSAAEWAEAIRACEGTIDADPVLPTAIDRHFRTYSNTSSWVRQGDTYFGVESRYESDWSDETPGAGVEPPAFYIAAPA